jgi:hypothetical protein
MATLLGIGGIMAKAKSLVFSVILAPAVIFATIAFVTISSPDDGGIDLSGMDRSIKPGDDFFGYANGTWFKTTQIPPDRSNYGLDARLADETNLRTRGLLEEAAKSAAPAGSDERMVGDYYAAYMNEAAIEARGIEGIRDWLDRIAAISDRRALVESIAQTIRRVTGRICCRAGLVCRTGNTTLATHPEWPTSETDTRHTLPRF